MGKEQATNRLQVVTAERKVTKSVNRGFSDADSVGANYSELGFTGNDQLG